VVSQSAVDCLNGADPRFTSYRQDHPKLVLDTRVIFLRLETTRFAKIKFNDYKAVSCKFDCQKMNLFFECVH
jgi:hypothetical protein